MADLQFCTPVNFLQQWNPSLGNSNTQMFSSSQVAQGVDVKPTNRELPAVMIFILWATYFISCMDSGFYLTYKSVNFAYV